jgi:hypothetical protein
MKIILILILLINLVIGNNININAVQYIGSGYDLKKGIAGLAPLFKYTYDDGNTWTSPNSNITYKVPDQLVVSKYNRVDEVVLTGYYNSYDEYLNEYTSWFNFDISLNIKKFGLGFKYNKQLGYVHEQMKNTTLTNMNGHHTWYYYDADMYPPNILEKNDMFQLEIESLPKTINTSKDRIQYQNFIETFGTHYMYRSIFGGKCIFDVMTSDTVIDNYSKSWTSTQYGFYFHYVLFNISSGGFTNRSDITINNQYLKNSNSNITFLGGNPSLANINNITDWVNTIDEYTFPINSTLNGLWELIDDPIKSLTLKDFIIRYLNSNNKKRLKGDINIRRQRRNNNKLAGINCIGHGIDTTTLDGCLAPIVQLEYNHEGGYPIGVYNQSYPDSFLVNMNVTETTSFSGKTWQYFYHHYHTWFGFGSKSIEVYKFYENFYKKQKSLVTNWLFISYERLTYPLLPPPKLSKPFEDTINQLPRCYNITTRDKYFYLFETFGTAIIDELTLGGKFKLDIWYDSQFISEKDIEWIKRNAHYSFLGIAHWGSGSEYSYKHVDKKFNTTMLFDYSYLGGNPTYKPDEWNKWLPTIQDNMEVVQYHLEPIRILIDDPIIRDNIDRAFDDYKAKAVIELDDYIHSLQ